METHDHQPPGRVLLGCTPTEFDAVARQYGLAAFAARQISNWIYAKRVTTFDQMTNIPKRDRTRLDTHCRIGLTAPVQARTSTDGTRKYLFAVTDGKHVETVAIPDRRRMTLCLSTQVGCKMGCRFCLTGRQGFHGNLIAGDILNQVLSVPAGDDLTNIVYMGMGEPLDNLDAVLRSLEILTAPWGLHMSPRRITVSTIGMAPALVRLIDESECHIAISLHSPFQEERAELAPISTAHPLADVLAALRSRRFGRQRRLSFEYILFKDVNDTPRHVRELVRQLGGLRCRVNLIRYHPIPGSPLSGSPEKTVQAFRTALVDKGIRATVRISRGQDIDAACGLLATHRNS